MSARKIPSSSSYSRSSTTTFSAGASLTIAKNVACTLTIRHPRTLSIRRAESRAKALLSACSDPSFVPSVTLFHHLAKIFFLTAVTLVPLIPIALHILHRNALITVLTHVPAAVLSLLILHLLTLFPHKPYLAITATQLFHRPRGLLSGIQIHPLSLVRSFSHNGNLIIADTVSPTIHLKAPDKQTASAAVQALNTALTARDHRKPPENPLETPGQLVITANTPLCECELPPERIEIITKGDRVNIFSVAPEFPRIFFMLTAFLVAHAISTVLLMFVFNDLPRRISPITGSMISTISIGGVYVISLVSILVYHLIKCIPKKWKLIVAGYRGDVKSGLIDVGRCREVILVRNKKGFGVKIISNHGNTFVDVEGLSEGEASKLIRTLRTLFPMLFQSSV